MLKRFRNIALWTGVVAGLSAMIGLPAVASEIHVQLHA